MDPVIRMFTSGAGTVRWETTLAGAEGLQFNVSGPDSWRNSSVFADAFALAKYQKEYESFLKESGYSVSLVNDRRSGLERRVWPREGKDRRRT
jgi:hypothetical protein